MTLIFSQIVWMWPLKVQTSEEMIEHEKLSSVPRCSSLMLHGDAITMSGLRDCRV